MSEMILESTLDSLPGIFYMLDNKGFLVKWNRKFEEVSGYTGKELAGMNALDLFRGSNKELIAARIGEVFKKGSSDAEADFVSKDGTATPYYFSGEAVKTDGVIYLFGMGFNISDRKQVEASLLESEEQFRTIFEKSPIGIELYDASGIQVAANKTSCDMFGIKDDSSKGFNLFSGTSLTEELKQQLRTGIPIAYQTTFDFNKVRELGQYRTWRSGKADMDYRITPLTSREKEGSLGYLVQVQEITERRNNERIQRVLYNISNAVITTRDLEELLEIIHAQLGLLVDANNFYVAFYDEQSDILNSPYSKDQKDEINSWPAARSITGHVIYTNESLLATKTEVLEMISSGVIEMIGIPSESWLGVPLRSDGKAIGALVVQSYDNPQAYKAEDLQILEFISAQVSLSIQRKQADISLRESEERFRTLTEVASDAIISIDSKGFVRMFNGAAERMFGYDAKEIYGLPVSVFIPGRYGRIFMGGIDQYFLTGNSTILGRIFEFKGKRKNGEVFPLELSLSDVHAGSETNFFGIVRDITHRKRTEMQIQKFTTALQESNATKDKFFSIIAHDLKSPFNAILGLTNALIEDYKSLDEKRIENLLTTIKTSSERAFELLENLLTWANAQTGQVDYKPQQVGLTDLIEESVALLEGTAVNKGIRIESRVTDKCRVFADRQMILTVLRNLVSNAVKFTPFGGSILIEVKPGKDGCMISVRDSGIGISKEDVDRLFRIDSKHSTRGTADEKGTGLGLILCKEFVAKHGGKIWVESEEGKGSTFSFSLPTEH